MQVPTVLRSIVTACLLALPFVSTVAQESSGDLPHHAQGMAPPAIVTHYPLGITSYDIMTAEDEFYYHHLSKLCQGGDVAEWPLVKTKLADQYLRAGTSKIHHRNGQ
jgi:hypothetical protein